MNVASKCLVANVRLNRAGPATFRKVSLQGFSTMERDLQVRHYWVIPVQPFQFTLVLKPCNWLVSSLESHLKYEKNVTDYCVEIFIVSAL